MIWDDARWCELVRYHTRHRASELNFGIPRPTFGGLDFGEPKYGSVEAHARPRTPRLPPKPLARPLALGGAGGGAGGAPAPLPSSATTSSPWRCWRCTCRNELGDHVRLGHGVEALQAISTEEHLQLPSQGHLGQLLQFLFTPRDLLSTGQPPR